MSVLPASLAAELGVSPDDRVEIAVDRVRQLRASARAACAALQQHVPSGTVVEMAEAAADSISSLGRALAQARTGGTRGPVPEPWRQTARRLGLGADATAADLDRAVCQLLMRAQPASATPVGTLPGWDDARLAALADRVDPAGMVRAALGRDPTREELLAAALAALERRLGGGS